MNARILRKWSIHTKNLMSCSASSLVVVVLLLLLLLVTCAPTLVLATMNQSPRTTTSSLLLSSSPPLDAPAPAPRVVENPLHMPKNVQVVVVGAEATQTRQSRPSSTATAIASATSSSSQQQQQQQPPATSWLPYRSHSRLASPRVEVATNGDIMTRESFPGFYNTNRRNRPDDIRPAPAIWPLPLRHQQLVAPHHHLVPMTTSSDGMAKPPRLNSGYVTQNKDILNTPSSSSASRMGWPQRLITSSSPMESYNDDNEDAGNNEDDDINLDEVDDEEDDVDVDDIDEDEDDTQSNDNNKPNNNTLAANSHDNEELQEFEADIIKPRLSVRNVVDTAATSSSSYATQQHSSSAGQQLYNLRRLDDRRHQVAPLTMQHHTPSFPKLTPQEERPPPPSLKKNRMMTTTTTTTKTTLYSYKQTEQSGSPIFSAAEHKSKAFETDKVFDISNILNVNKIKSSAAASPIRFVIESYEVASQPLSSEHRRTATSGTALQGKNLLPRLRQLRSRHQQQQQTARSRRDSLRSSYNKRNQQQVADSNLSHFSSSSSSPTITHNQSFRKLNANAQSHHHNNNNNNNNQHHHHHRNNNLRQQRMRNKHARRYCSARDPAQLAFEAPTVFEGKIVSMTPDRRMNFSATVEVREVFKQQIGYRLQKYLRLQFAYRNSSGECDIYREQLRPRGLVKGDTIEPGRMYLLFVQQIDIGNFTILGQPIKKTKRVVEAVRNAVSENYAQLASIRSISASNRTVENGQELRIVCKVTGRPPPKVTWFKDHRSINRNRKLYQFTHYKKRSELIIRSFNTSDAGRYECRAKNKVNRNIERRAIVIKAYPVQRFDPNPRGAGNTCPDDASEFCFNGGTCKFFSEISSYSCICPEGFIGERCDRKEVNNPSTYSNEQECGDKKYFGSYYC